MTARSSGGGGATREEEEGEGDGWASVLATRGGR